MATKNTKAKEPVAQATPAAPSVQSEKAKLLALYQTLKDLGVRSIGDLENLIAKAE